MLLREPGRFPHTLPIDFNRNYWKHGWAKPNIGIMPVTLPIDFNRNYWKLAPNTVSQAVIILYRLTSIGIIANF